MFETGTKYTSSRFDVFVVFEIVGLITYYAIGLILNHIWHISINVMYVLGMMLNCIHTE